jgi:16S rRNA processing protein RimM
MDAPEKIWVWLARVRHPQGRKGEVFAEILTDFPERFAERRHLWLLPEGAVSQSAPTPPSSQSGAPGATPSRSSAEARPVELVHHWQHKGGIVLHFTGVNSISEAETLSGLIVAVPREQRAPLAEDEVYIADLIGCTLVDVAEQNNPKVVGTIENVEREAGPVPLLMVHSGENEILVPFARSFMRSLDLTSRRVEMDLPEGLLDLNA